MITSVIITRVIFHNPRLVSLQHNYFTGEVNLYKMSAGPQQQTRSNQ